MCATGSASVCSAKVVQNQHWQSQWHPKFWLRQSTSGILLKNVRSFPFKLKFIFTQTFFEEIRIMQIRAALSGVVTLSVVLSAFSIRADEWVSGIPWPEVKVVTPGNAGTPPSDAIVLFDGKSLAQWEDGDKWIVQDGCATTAVKDIHTKQAFGDCQLHIEWAEPAKVEGDGQGRGNSGVFLMGLYEVQILDSFENATYTDGQCGAIYKQHPPLANACRKPGEWQTYDIIFEAPRFKADGSLARPAYITVLQNGVLVQNHFEIQGTTAWDTPPKYTAHAAKLPLGLQFHNNPLQYRNIWIREVKPSDAPAPAKAK
jgi:hypothetical protein